MSGLAAEAAQVRAALQRAGLRAPEMLTVALTQACNLDCAHCWVDAGPRPAIPVATTALLEIFAQFAHLGGTTLQLTGGEPLLHPAWRELLLCAAEHPFERIVLQTNGLLFGDGDFEVLRRVAAPRLRIQISLDGASGASHDLVRGAGTFDATLAALHRLIGAGFASQLTLFFTEMQHNLHELPDLLALGEELGVAAVVSGTLVHGGRAANGGELAPPDPEQYLALLERYRQSEDFRRRYAAIGCTAALEWARSDRQGRDCCGFVSTPYLGAGGKLYPCLMCHAVPYAVSGVFEAGLFAALRAGIPQWTRLMQIVRCRAETVEDCRSCVLRQDCAAGCAGRAWGSCGDFQVVEDRCRQRLAVHRWREEHQLLSEH